MKLNKNIFLDEWARGPWVSNLINFFTPDFEKCKKKCNYSQII